MTSSEIKNETMWLRVVAAVGAASLAVVVLLLRRRRSSPLSTLPGPPLPAPLWRSLFLGHFYEIKNEPPCVPHLRWAKKYGSVVYYSGVLLRPRLLVADPAVLSDVLVTRASLFRKPPNDVCAVPSSPAAPVDTPACLCGRSLCCVASRASTACW